ncbi:MAG: hypothetical protein M3167_06300 [Acidobacteriota bacterium]|nr:hypothetical protein [Acidobacteriota bacterium]MDQ6892275.1 hypothetical protein [Acidobacteriota bacterium]
MAAETPLDRGGILHSLYMGGKILKRDPNPIQLAPLRWETRTRTANMSLRVDRGFILAGLPNVLDKQAIVVPYRNVPETDLLEHLTALLGVGQPFDVCMWKQHREVYDTDGAATTYFLQRRPASPTMQPFVAEGTNLEIIFPEYATRVEFYSASYGSAPGLTVTRSTVVYKTEAQIAAGSPAPGEAWIGTDGKALGGSLALISSMKFGTAPAAGVDRLIVSYVPLYRMTVESDAGRSFAAALEEARSIKLAEV